MTRPTLNFLLLVTIAIAASTTYAVVHQMQATQQQVPIEVLKMIRGVPTNHFQKGKHEALVSTKQSHIERVQHLEREIARFKQISGPLHMIAQHDDDSNSTDPQDQGNGSSSSSLSSTIPLDVSDYGWVIVGNMSVGTPPQQLRLDIDVNRAHLYVIATDATYSSWWSSSETAVDDKQTFNSSASSTYAANSSESFETDYMYKDGEVGSDVLHVGDGLSSNVTVQVASDVPSWLSYYSLDGTLGLASSDNDSEPTLVSELIRDLDQPVVTMWLNRSGSGGNGEITLGGLNPIRCQSASWANVGNRTSYYNLPVLNVSSVNGPSGTDGCQNSVQVNLTVYVENYYAPIYTSIQVLSVFVKASGGAWNSSSYRYEVTDEQLATAQPVTMTLPSGDQLVLMPDDYIVRKSDGSGNSQLYVYGSYDQNKYPTDYITLGQQFLNNHCVSKNLATGDWSLAPLVHDQEDAVGDNGGSSPS